jgi:hypothetical protein
MGGVGDGVGGECECACVCLCGCVWVRMCVYKTRALDKNWAG